MNLPGKPRTARLRDGPTATEALPNYGQFSQESRVREPATVAPVRAPTVVPPPLDLADWLGDLRVEPADKTRRARGVARQTGLDERLARPAAYLAKIPPAVAGERGHDRTFHAACVLVQGFDLTIDEARPLLHQWNLGCIPPWSPGELEHKLQDALRGGDSRPRGYLCNRDPHTPAPAAGRDHRRRTAGAGSTVPPPHRENPPPHSSSPHLGHCPAGQEANPHRLALAFLTSGFAFAGGTGLRHWRDEFHAWDGSAYHALPDGEIRAQLTRWIAGEFERLYRLALREMDRQTGENYRSDSSDQDPGITRAAAATTKVCTAPDTRYRPAGE